MVFVITGEEDRRTMITENKQELSNEAEWTMVIGMVSVAKVLQNYEDRLGYLF